MHAKSRLRAKPALVIHVQYYAATNATTGYTKRRNSRQPETRTTVTPAGAVTTTKMTTVTTTPVTTRMKVRMKMMENRRETPAMTTRETMMGASAMMGAVTKSPTRVMMNQAEILLMMQVRSSLHPAGSKRPSHPRVLLDNRNHQSNQEDFRELTQ